MNEKITNAANRSKNWLSTVLKNTGEPHQTYRTAVQGKPRTGPEAFAANESYKIGDQPRRLGVPRPPSILRRT